MVSRDKKRCKKMLEHRQMIILSMQYLLEKWLNMCIKYEIIQDKKLLENIVSEIPGVFFKVKACLGTFVNQGVDWSVFNKSFI